MAYTKYSLTPANNNAAPPDGAPEGMLPSAVNDTMRDMMAQIRDCGDGIRGGTYTMTAPVITGGSINGTTVGASTASTGAFTTLSASSTVSGTGFSNYFASPPALGGTAAAAVSSTNLSYTGTLTGGTGVINIGSGQFYKDASGNVGIGTTSPTEKLTSNNGFLSIGAVSTTARDGAIVDYSGNIARFIAGRAGGNYGQWEAHVAGASGVTKRYQIDYDGTTYWYGANGTTERMRIDSSGNLLVGTTSTSRTANIGIKNLISTSPDVVVVGSGTTNSDVAFEAYSTGASAFRFQVGYGGTIYATSTTITGISDQRLKENIVDLDDGLDAVMALKPRKFDWKAGKGKDIKGDRGFIAQEFEQVFPDMIEESKDPVPEGEKPYKAVNANIIPTLVKAIQEQQVMIEELKAKVAALEAA